MKRFSIMLLLGVLCSCSRNQVTSSFDQSRSSQPFLPAREIQLNNARLDEVLALYQQTSGRVIVRATNLPDATISFTNETPLTRVQLLQTLDSALAAKGIAAIAQDENKLKVVRGENAHLESSPIRNASLDELPDSASYVTCLVKLGSSKDPGSIISAMTKCSRLPYSTVYVPGERALKYRSQLPVPDDVFAALGPHPDKILILRDYSCNVRKMLQAITNAPPDNR